MLTIVLAHIFGPIAILWMLYNFYCVYSNRHFFKMGVATLTTTFFVPIPLVIVYAAWCVVG